MKIKITYTNGMPWQSKELYKELTATSEGETKDKALNNFYMSPEGKLSKTTLKTEIINNQ